MSEGYIGVDFDGTLATYDGWKGVGVLGEPVHLMCNRVMLWLSRGQEVKVFTARVANEDLKERDIEIEAIEKWCLRHLGRKLKITCVKDQFMKEYWDDRAVRVVANTGMVSDGSDVVEAVFPPGDIGAVM